MIKELEEYEFDDSIWNDDEKDMYRLKYVISNKLELSDRIIILQYADLGSIRKLAKKLNISPALAWLQVDRIRKKIKEYL